MTGGCCSVETTVRLPCAFLRIIYSQTLSNLLLQGFLRVGPFMASKGFGWSQSLMIHCMTVLQVNFIHNRFWKARRRKTEFWISQNDAADFSCCWLWSVANVHFSYGVSAA